MTVETGGLLEPLERATLPAQAVRSLKRFILAEGLTAGARLPSERALSETLGVSRNVIREALETLAAEGLIAKQPGRCAVVCPYDPQHLEDGLEERLRNLNEIRALRELRVALEIGVITFVVPRISPGRIAILRRLVDEMAALANGGQLIAGKDREFHHTLCAEAQNPEISALQRQLQRRLQVRSLAAADAGQLQSAAHSVRTLRALVDALERRDLEAAEAAMREHLTADLPPQGARVFLFVDDFHIAARRNVTRTLGQAIRHRGNPVLSAEQPWEGSDVMPGATVLYDSERKEFRMWYQGYRYLSPFEEQYNLCYAVSMDGVHWRRPALDIVEFEGSTRNNILIPWGDPQRADPKSPTIFYEPHAADPARRYTMVYVCHGLHPVGLGVAYSADGLRWQPLAQNPVDSGGKEPVGDALYVTQEPGGRGFGAYYRVRLRVRPRRSLARAESTDLLAWANHHLVLQADEGDPPDAEVYGLTPFRYGDLWLGFLWLAGGQGSRVEIQLASSRDGEQWHRVGDRRPFLPAGPAAAFDAAVISHVTVPVVVGSELWFYYRGAGRPLPPAAGAYGASGIGLATLGMDRFVSLDAADPEGEVLTSPLFVGDQTLLLLNAAANPGGYVLTEIVDQDGAPIPGFTRRDVVGFTDNAHFHPVQWSGRDLAELRGQTVQIRFILRHAHLYAYRLSQPGSAPTDLLAGICK